MPSTSTTTLGTLLFELGAVRRPFTTRDVKAGRAPVEDETFGTRSFIFVHVADMDQRALVERAADAAGFNVTRHYSPGRPVCSIQVSYFKGYHWDE